jgi:hypothetical protein
MAKTMKTKGMMKSAPPKKLGMAKAPAAPIPKTKGKMSSRKA